MVKIKRSNFFQILKNNQGFSILEILIALFIGGLLFSTLNFGGNSAGGRKKVDRIKNQIESAIRFASDEAALRNVIVRVHFLLDKDPQEYNVQYGPDANFILPRNIVTDREKLTLSQRENQDKKQENLNKNFNNVSEFEKRNIDLPPTIKIVGLGNAESEVLQFDGEASIYVYPSGEKDETMVFFGTEDEVITLEVPPYSTTFASNYYELQLPQDQEPDLEDLWITQAKDLFTTWLK